MRLLINIAYSIISTCKMFYAYRSSKNKQNMMQAEIIRNVHSIEKGMCIKNPRLGFGVGKISKMISLIDSYIDNGFPGDRPEIKMAISSLKSYISFHEDRHFSNEYIEHLITEIARLEVKCKISVSSLSYGGTIDSTAIKHFGSIENVNFKELLFNRHSIRKFSSKPINKEDLISAIDLANRCPSACNRQTTRVYVINKEKIDILKDWLSGIGGFAESVDKFLIITGKTSSFNDGEVYQHIVSASIFVGYLSLTLTAYNIGNCIVQRPLLYSRKWRQFAKDNNIPSDENIVCMMAIGNYEDDFKVPVSYRMNSKYLMKYL